MTGCAFLRADFPNLVILQPTYLSSSQHPSQSNRTISTSLVLGTVFLFLTMVVINSGDVESKPILYLLEIETGICCTLTSVYVFVHSSSWRQNAMAAYLRPQRQNFWVPHHCLNGAHNLEVSSCVSLLFLSHLLLGTRLWRQQLLPSCYPSTLGLIQSWLRLSFWLVRVY